MEWEEYTIKITHKPSDEDSHLEELRSRVTDSFETKLLRLIREYEGQVGLHFDARNSLDHPIKEY